MLAAFWPICRREEVADPGAKEFELYIAGTTVSGFVLHWRGQWYAYRNSCPHTGVNLNWLPDQFFDVGLEYVQCSLHGALFQPQDGLCIHGPCVGRYLERLPVVCSGAEIGIDPSGLTPA